MIPILQQALAREMRGDLAGAITGYREVLARAPNHVDALYLLGRAQCQSGQFKPGLENLRKVVALAPAHAPAHNLIGMVLNQMGHPSEALAAFERAVSADSQFAPAVANLADALAALGRNAEAVAQFDRALALDSGNVVAWCNRGLALEALGRDAAAAASFERALALQPGLAVAHFNLGNALVRLRRLDEAIQHYRRSAELAPDLIPAHYRLGQALWQSERYAESIASFDHVLVREPRHIGALNAKARVLYTLGRLPEACALIEQAITIEPNDPGNYLNLSEMKRFEPDDPQIAAMEMLVPAIAKRPAEERGSLHFALAKAYGDSGEPEAAFRHLVEANALKRAQLAYDEAATLVSFERIASVFTPALMREKSGQGNPSRQPIFIIGMPRSGTTLIEQILASHPSVYGAGEREDFQAAVFSASGRTDYPELVRAITPAQLAALGSAYIERVARSAPPCNRFTDKLPANFAYAGLIHLALPHARIIHCRRDPIDTCLSCFSISFRNAQKFAYDLGELGRFYRAYEKLMAHWRMLLPAEVMIEVQYENVVADLEAEARRLLAHCGLEWNDACLAFHKIERPVRTASAAQVRQPIHGGSVGRWRVYRDQLQPLFSALGITPD
jgi:tetratricopeptide (TPR) repeat protein